MNAVELIRNDLHEDESDVLFPSTFEGLSSSNVVRIDEYYHKTFCFVSLIGLHIFKIRPNGEVLICYMRACARVFILSLAIFASCESLAMKIYFGWPMWFVIMTLPFWYAAVYSVLIYISLTRHRKIHQIFVGEVVKLNTRGTYNITLKIFYFVLYVGIFVVTACAVIPRSMWMILSPVLLTMLIPTILDIYMSIFGQAIMEALVDLTERITASEKIDVDFMNVITADYLFIQNILDLFNELSSPIKTYRVFLFGMQSTGLLYTLFSFQDPMHCLDKFIPFLMSLFESIIRFYMICERADCLYRRGVCLYESIVDKLVGTPHEQAEVVTRLSALAGRLRVQPMAVHSSGFGIMDGSTFVGTSTLILTYLLLLVSMKPSMKTADDDFTTDTGLAKCFTFEAHNHTGSSHQFYY